MKKWYGGMLVVVALFFGSVIIFNIVKEHMIAYFIKSSPIPVYPVTTTTIQKKSWQPIINTIGFIKPSQGIELSCEQSGIIKKINFSSGQKVTKGDLLIALDTNVEQAKLREAKTQLPYVKESFERLKKLYQQKTISEQAMDDAEAKYLLLKAQIESLQATIERRLVKAPFSGIIGIKNIYVGQYISAGNALVRLENTDTMRINFNISQRDIGKVTTDLSLNILVGAYPEMIFKGKITAIEPAVSSANGMIEVQASIPNNQGILRSEMYAKVTVLLPKEHQQLVIPVEAINFQMYGEYIYLVHRQKSTSDQSFYYQVEQKMIHVHDRDDHFAKVTANLKPGDQIVTSGQVRLSNHSRIKIVKNNTLDIPAAVPRL